MLVSFSHERQGHGLWVPRNRDSAMDLQVNLVEMSSLFPWWLEKRFLLGNPSDMLCSSLFCLANDQKSNELSWKMAISFEICIKNCWYLSVLYVKMIGTEQFLSIWSDILLFWVVDALFVQNLVSLSSPLRSEQPSAVLAVRHSHSFY